ncbi:hypothetical protein FHS00_001329 [Limimaricola variabilis]|uniref:DUF2383 domain-containing protein n=1 Tax=Limimaricola variabilis TaxID=1492771 RepID=A0ABR6HMT7_9RHOB|nr:hypothetical protein [Limimaricola variabilis]MBB3711758.1 hypothetical protein [Limimaricola variabilis]
MTNLKDTTPLLDAVCEARIALNDLACDCEFDSAEKLAMRAAFNAFEDALHPLVLNACALRAQAEADRNTPMPGFFAPILRQMPEAADFVATYGKFIDGGDEYITRLERTGSNHEKLEISAARRNLYRLADEVAVDAELVLETRF